MPKPDQQKKGQGVGASFFFFLKKTNAAWIGFMEILNMCRCSHSTNLNVAFQGVAPVEARSGNLQIGWRGSKRRKYTPYVIVIP